MSRMDPLLAGVCRICPFCIASRRWPDSGYARALRRLERACPFCAAYRRRASARRKNER